MVSQPAKAVILLFPITEPYEQKRREEDNRIAEEGQHPVDPTLFWMKQTASCAADGLLQYPLTRRNESDLQRMRHHGALALSNQRKEAFLRVERARSHRLC